MAPYQPFASLSEAILKALAVVKEGFELDTGENGAPLLDKEKTNLQIFSSQWLVKSKPLAMQIRNLLVTLFKADNMSAEERKREPGLTVCKDI